MVALVDAAGAQEVGVVTAHSGSSADVWLTLGGAAAIIVVVLITQLLEGRRQAPIAAGSEPEPPRTVWLVLTLGLLAIYVVSRVALLDRLPAFKDEAMHILWARSPFGAYFDAEIDVGKWLPLQWMALLVRLPLAPLTAARLASVTMGLATLAGCVLIGRELFSWRTGIAAGAVYVVLPFAVLYDRLALVDVYVSAAAAGAVWCALRLRHARGAGADLGLTACLSAAVLSKPTGGLFVVVPLLVLLVVPRSAWARYLGRCLPALLGVVALLAFLLAREYGTGLVAEQSAFAFATVAARLHDNLHTAREWFAPLFTPAIGIALAAAAALAVVQLLRGRREETLLFALLALAFVPYAVVSSIWHPRYILFTVVPMALLVARAVVATAAGLAARMSRSGAVERRVGDLLTVGIAALVLLPMVLQSFVLVTDPAAALLSDDDRQSYITGWTAGYGVPELATFIGEQTRVTPLNLVGLADQGLADEWIDVYLPRDPRVSPYLVDKDPGRAAGQVASLATTRRTLFVLRSGAGAPDAALSTYLRDAERIWIYARPGGDTTLQVWEVPRAADAAAEPGGAS